MITVSTIYSIVSVARVAIMSVARVAIMGIFSHALAGVQHCTWLLL